jgi:carbamoyl-phosphate synthase large subunit
MKLNVLIAGAGGALASSIVKALRLAPFEFNLVAAGQYPWAAALHGADRGVALPAPSEGSYVSSVKGICVEEGIDAVFAGTEHDALVLSSAREEIHRESGATALVSDTDTLMAGYDRWCSARFLKAGGLNCPETVLAGDRNAVVRMISRHGYPVVVKPRMGLGREGLVVARDEETLEYAIRRPKGLLVQEYLPGDESEYAAGLFVRKDGGIGGSICMRRVAGAGGAVVVEVGDFPEIRAEAERVAAAVKSAGPCTVRIRATGRGPVAFAVEPYFSRETACRAACGFNEVELTIRHYLLGEDVQAVCGWRGLFVAQTDEVLIPLEARRLPDISRRAPAGDAATAEKEGVALAGR